jgi:hypothetical protein
MSAFYDQASLVVVPSGYKSGKIYAQKPLTTDGQLTFTRASTATRVNASGLIETVASGVPRLDYLGSSCPKILLEPQRSNLVTYSQEFDNAAWSKSGATVTANDSISPDGTQNADKIVFSGANNQITQTFNVSNHTFSVYVKGTAGETIVVGFGAGAQIIHTLTGGFDRVSVTGSSSFFVFIGTFDGATARTIYLYGAQLEAGAYATSYIPTTSAAVTRLADAALTASVPSLIGQTEGTLYAEMTRESLAESFFMILSNIAGTTALAYYNSIYIFQLPSANFVSDCFINNVAQYNFSYPSGLSIGTHKIALAYKQNDFALYIDGVQIATDTSGNLPTMNYFTIGGGADVTGHKNLIKQTLLFKTRLTNAQLAELTTL